MFLNADGRLTETRQISAPPVRVKNKGKGSPYSTITERGVPELIPVLGSQLACDVSHKPGGTFRQACSYPRNSRHLQADCQEPGSALEPYARQSSMGSTLYPISLPFEFRVRSGFGVRRQRR